MRDDRQNLGDELVDSKAWENRDEQFRKSYYVTKDEHGKPIARAHPFSGGERNRFFANTENGFVDLTPLSGTDSPGDSRSFAYLDFDGDGDHDLALTNANSPGFELWKTEVAKPGNFLAISLEGGARPDDTEGWTNRSAIGAFVTVTTPSGLCLVRELHCGEGFGSQNSKTLIFGLAKDTEGTSVEVRWPSGRTTEIAGPLAAGHLLQISERDGQSTATQAGPYPILPRR